jgi:hypothetical protein
MAIAKDIYAIVRAEIMDSENDFLELFDEVFEHEIQLWEWRRNMIPIKWNNITGWGK